MKIQRSIVVIAFALIAFGVAVGLRVFTSQPPESPLDRAKRICKSCGLDFESTAWLIDQMRHATLTREQQLQLFRVQFEDASEADICEPCANAILDVAHDPA